MTDESKLAYGLSTNLFISRKASGDSYVLGGMAENAARWTRVLSPRAVQMLWFQLARFLFPDNADLVTSASSTTPLRSSTMPTITSHVTINKQEDGRYEIVGWIDGQTWNTFLAETHVREFWNALDIVLYPAGWQGKDSLTGSS